MKKTFALIAMIMLALAAVGLHSLFLREEFNWAAEPASGGYEHTIIVAADRDYPPYSFIDEHGNYAGHDVELIYALGQRLELNIDLRLINWDDALAGLDDGSIDVLMGMTYTDYRSEIYGLSMPIVNDPYVAFGFGPVEKKLDNIVAGKLCTIRGDSINQSFIRPYQLEGNTTFYDTYSECFQSLIDGKTDYVISPYLTGIRIIDEFGFKGVGVVSPSLTNSFYCMGTAKENTELLNDLNAAIKEMVVDGSAQVIYDRWLIDYIYNPSIGEFIKTNIEKVIIAVLALLLMLVMVYYLIQKRNKEEIYIQTERARIFEETSDDLLFEYVLDTDCFSCSYKDKDGIMLRSEQPGYMRDRVFEQSIAQESLEIYENILHDVITGEDKVTGECKTSLLGGEWRWGRFTLRRITDYSGTLISIVGRVQDIHQVVAERNAALEMAATDQLTGLFSRNSLMLETSERLKKTPGGYAFIILDLDDFKCINDTYGHAEGDQALCHVARVMNRVFSASDILGRFGGDEFLVFMECSNRGVVEKRLTEFLTLLSKPADDKPYSVYCSIGCIFTIADSEMTSEKLFHYADTALYRAKHLGKNRYCFWGD